MFTKTMSMYDACMCQTADEDNNFVVFLSFCLYVKSGAWT